MTGPAPDPDDPAVLEYRTRRRWPGPSGAGGRIRVRRGPALTEPDPVARFVTARFGLHTRWAGRTLFVPNEHPPWPLRRAELLDLDDTLLTAAGFPGLVERPPDSVLCSDGTRTRFGRPRIVRTGRAC
jgi:uncharacterized protein YqjF (DUF2071 family)